MQVTSNVMDAQQMTIKFANQNLSGKTKVLEDYDSSKTRVCVTVGMMTTGYDCEDLLNVVLLRPIFSPTDFVQMKGRGTRKFTFTYEDSKKAKERFKLFDFFAVCEYFEKEFKYDKAIPLSTINEGKSFAKKDIPVSSDAYENFTEDTLQTYAEVQVGSQGMKIDRAFFSSFSTKVKTQPDILKNFETGSFEKAVELANDLLNKPAEFFTLQKLTKALQLNRIIQMREILNHIINGTPLKDNDGLLEEECNKFISIYGNDIQNLSDKFNSVLAFFKLYLTDENFQKIMKEKKFSELETMQEFSQEELQEIKPDYKMIMDYADTYVNKKMFAKV